MIKNFILCFCLLILFGCSSLAGELIMNTAAGALGNMLDRRIENELGNSAEKFDEMLEPKLKKETVNNERENCENDKWGRIDWRL